MNTLYLKPEDESVEQFYKNHSSYHEGDSGLDLFVPNDIEIKCGETVFIDLKIKCEMLNDEKDNLSYYLYPRSSISKTPLISVKQTSMSLNIKTYFLRFFFFFLPSIFTIMELNHHS